MAERALQKVEDQLNCSICLDTYTDPKLLQCFHVYCQKCLIKLVIRDQQRQLTLTCPICRQVTPIPAKGVAGLPPAFQVNKLLEIVDEHKRARSVDSSAEVDSVVHVYAAASPAPPFSKKGFCLEHTKKELELYCETCEDFICFHCVLKSGRHHSHDYELLDDAFEKYKGDISASVEPMEKQLASVNGALVKLDDCCAEITDKEARIEAEIHKDFERLHTTLNARRTELIDQLHKLTQEKLKALATHRDLLETKEAQLSSCLGLVRESVKAGSEGEVLRMKTGIARQVKKLTSEFQPNVIEPNAEADIVYLPSDLVSLCASYGSISAGPTDEKDGVNNNSGLDVVSVISQPTPDSPSSGRSEVKLGARLSGAGEQHFMAGSRSGHVLMTERQTGSSLMTEQRSQAGRSCRSMLSRDVEASVYFGGEVREQVRPPHSTLDLGRETELLSGLRLNRESMASHHSQPVSMMHKSWPLVARPYQFGRSLPANLPAARMQKSLKVTVVTTIKDLQHPWGVAPSRPNMVLTNGISTKIFFFSGVKNQLSSIPIYGGNTLFSLAVQKNQNILATDNLNHQIVELSPEGRKIKQVGSKGSGPLQFSHPEGIAVNMFNNKVYVSDLNHRIQVLNSDLSFSSTFGVRGENIGEFSCPWGVACDNETGHVYVADSKNHRIQVFTAEGRFLRMFGGFGAGYGQLSGPAGIALDHNTSRVYVSEYKNRRISVFTIDGLFVGSFDGKGAGEWDEGFAFPCGLAVGSDGAVWVCDSDNNSVKAFKINSPLSS